jgi:hypothetical protein
MQLTTGQAVNIFETDYLNGTANYDGSPIARGYMMAMAVTVVTELAPKGGYPARTTWLRDRMGSWHEITN